MSGSTIKHAIEAVKEKGIHTDLELYDAIERCPGESVYALAKLMGWSGGKTYASVRRLEKSEMVHIQKTLQNGRDVLTVKAKSWETYFTPAELAEMQRPEFMNEVEAIVEKANLKTKGILILSSQSS
ncbi:MAG: MarR family transcriptional regulator [Methanotrichaceae archaeon]|nr:MarR family transcriptional regulator [Methanotrichaceae archaeon]